MSSGKIPEVFGWAPTHNPPRNSDGGLSSTSVQDRGNSISIQLVLHTTVCAEIDEYILEANRIE